MRQLTTVKPFRMIENLYFVGTVEASSHLIATREGLILIDTGYVECADIVMNSIRELGFNVEEIKYIIHSHGHADHTEATAEILKHCKGAKTLLSFRDLRYIKGFGFTPDIDITDGYKVKLGETEILCLFTPGHTEGSCSFFFNVTENGVTHRAGCFGGAGTNQLKKDYMNRRCVPYLMRGEFFRSVDRLLTEQVDVMIGNHAWQNKTFEKRDLIGKTEINPYVDKGEWQKFLKNLKSTLTGIILEESRTKFITYAHRGASEYCPENTMMSFYVGAYMGANGIETDVQITRDGVLVLFHDETLMRVTGEEGSVADYTYDELCRFAVKKAILTDRIPTFRDFLEHFGHRDLMFAIELKVGGIEKAVAELIYEYGVEKKVVITSFNFDYIKNMKECAPELRIGYLTVDIGDNTVKALMDIGGDEICPKGCDVTRERVDYWHSLGLNVRAWGIFDEQIMRSVYDAGADGMTVNFPDLLLKYIDEK